MFVIGETTGIVHGGKLALPKQYHLSKIKIIGCWKNKNSLYLSDNVKSLQYATGKRKCFWVNLDSNVCITLPMEYENMDVKIKGAITTIELIFTNI
jgi:hypothetical protein